MLLALLLAAVTCVHATPPFNITQLIVPAIVPPGQTDVEIECRYDADFTLLNWFKGPIEFLRYKPTSVPSIRTFSVLGVGNIEVKRCGPTVCRLRLSSITEEATGLYRCDIEREKPPYKFETRKANMIVHSNDHRRPRIQGMATTYGEEDEIELYCHGAEGSELRWYINGREIGEMRGSSTMKRHSSRLIFLGIPPTVNVQCAEFQNNKLLGSQEVKAKWKEFYNDEKKPQEQKSGCAIVAGVEYFVLITSWTIIRFISVI